MAKQNITEKDKVHEDWYKEAKEQTLETLPEFLKHLMEDYGHDYGTICHALASGAVATSHAMNRHSNGGITGFQAGAVMWEYMAHWNGIKPPAKLVKYDDMLYPQYENKFAKTISKDTWEHLQTEAKKQISEINSEYPPRHNVIKHWTSIVEGIIPFGYKIESE